VSVRYSDAGVDLTVAADVAARIKERVGNGLFGGFIPVSALKAYDSPVLVSSVDGVGTKVRLAAQLDRLDGLGADIVHHCVNDIAVHGAQPLFFLDYLAFHRLEPPIVDRIVASIASACEAFDIRLAGGETAEMPLVYAPEHFDLAGAIVGVVEESDIIDGRSIRAGDVVLGLPSSGLHTNGFSLVQALFSDDEYKHYEPSLSATLGEALLQPHRCYLDQIRTLVATGQVHGLAHITGGGIAGNVSRIIPAGLEAQIDLPTLSPLFELIQARGVECAEMRRVFNLGIGLIAVCDPQVLATFHTPFELIGEVQTSDSDQRRVSFRDCS
jgi:phosphoribosylformylglycinamidine cyclo-ligase